MSSWTSLCAQEHCRAATCLDPLAPEKGNLKVTANKDNLDNCVLPTLWQQFGEEPHMGVMVRCPQTFGRGQQFVQFKPFVCFPVRYDRDANKYWDRFYEMHQNKFFKNRQWLFSEFPELLPQGCDTSRTPEGQEASAPAYPELRETQHSRLESQKGDDHIPNHDVLREKQHTDYLSAVHSQEAAAFPGQHASFRILEVGCGAGNSVFPIINAIRGSDAFLYCFDFSSRAIQLVKEHPDYDPAVCHAFVQDICDDVSMFPFPQESLDVIVVVFVLSSIHPERMQRVLNRLASYLKHGGTILFRDYGRYDLAQLRFKKGQCLSENFYTRQDGTCVYFFMKDEVHQLFTNAGLEEVQNLEDRRLQVNRGKKVVMHRVWMQSKYRKPSRVPIS
ncbi:mRNA N(3)-methylcytidine methyltransferase METTL8 isoform X2 [Pangasianodon hypophthalmus]|uniref:mRNA N(3)-methylcytidine methyltransferase METTL8 isoform X2 n=1 Tax=Pangasianodon hypophthalmus TaxID=310915 RepID=UPI002306F0F6|nr:mRNA N(3)-methylcytidine methyltransferase METTL8 isoform X2 [Pangasianodon hypophthalmus]